MNKLSPYEKTTLRRYCIEVSCAMACYGVVLCSSLTLVQTMKPGWLRTLVAIAPVAPIAGLFVVFARYYSRQDELWRRIWLEAVALAAGVTTLIVMAGGFLENVGLPRLSSFWTYCLLVCLTPIFASMLARRYR
jgi:hypothetical protein